MPKLLAFDLDGTIVTRDHRLPDRIRDAIRRAEREGHTVTVITGRTERSARPYLEALGIAQPYGTSQGARITLSDGTVLHQELLDPDVVRSIMQSSRTSVQSYFVSAGERFYVDDPEHEGWGWARAEGHDLHAYHAYGGESADKLMFVAQDAAELQKAIKELHPDLMFYPWEGRYLEVTTAGAHKGEALKRIAAQLGFEQEDTVAFGDGLNDISMLRWAGRGIAVGKADPGVLEVADEHIPPPEEDGVAIWLERNLLKAAA
ncbi:MAG TPA: HAD family hydrolase [Deinococcales bacterium]|nr:HAD family hydrolase [Deinococcales bacterium]